MDENQNPMTVNEAANFLKVSRSTMTKLTAKNKIPCHRLGGGRLIRFFKQELLDWVRAGRPDVGQDRAETIASKYAGARG